MAPADRRVEVVGGLFCRCDTVHQVGLELAAVAMFFAHVVTVGNRAQNTTNAAAITTTATAIQTESLIG